jgi:flagellar hook-associated protein 3 FlgL
MRVTQSEMYRTFGSDIRNINEALAEVNSQVSSGKKLNDLADSPDGSSDLVMITEQALKVEMYNSNIDTGTYYLKSADSALNEANNLLSSIQTLGMQATAATLNSDSRAALVDQLRTYREQMISLGNSQIDGRYLFAGTSMTTIPFELSGDTVLYNGSSKVNTVPVSDGLEISQGVSGSKAFGSVFNTIDGLLAALDAGDVAGANTSLTQFPNALNELSQARGEIGTNLNQLQSLSGVLESKKALLTERKSSIEDANMVESTLRMSQLKSALDGALSVGGTILKQSNLFDILG